MKLHSKTKKKTFNSKIAKNNQSNNISNLDDDVCVKFESLLKKPVIIQPDDPRLIKVRIISLHLYYKQHLILNYF